MAILEESLPTKLIKIPETLNISTQKEEMRQLMEQGIHLKDPFAPWFNQELLYADLERMMAMMMQDGAEIPDEMKKRLLKPNSFTRVGKIFLTPKAATSLKCNTLNQTKTNFPS